MNNQPPAGSFSTHSQKVLQPRMVNIETRETCCQEYRDRRKENPSLCDEKNVRKKIKRKGRAPASSNDA